MPRKKSRKKLYEQCHEMLLEAKKKAQKNIKDATEDLNPHINGDSGDMSNAIEQRHKANIKRQKYDRELREILAALTRMEEGTYGICEETGEDIEEKRLLAVPWTRFSIEGAEIKEREGKRYVPADKRSDSLF